MSNIGMRKANKINKRVGTTNKKERILFLRSARRRLTFRGIPSAVVICVGCLCIKFRMNQKGRARTETRPLYFSVRDFIFFYLAIQAL